MKGTVIIGTDDHPLASVARFIYGVNVMRDYQQIAAGPPVVAEAFQQMRKLPNRSMRCGCCGEVMFRAQGVAVFRLQPASGLPDCIPVGICADCLHKYPADTDITRQSVITCTGYDPGPSREWRDTLN